LSQRQLGYKQNLIQIWRINKIGVFISIINAIGLYLPIALRTLGDSASEHGRVWSGAPAK